MGAKQTLLTTYQSYPLAEMQARASTFYDEMRRRRTVREFADRPVPRSVIEACLRTAGTAPSGANQQPWHFVAVSDSTVKSHIRQAAEAEEREFYERRASQEWLDALAPLGTDAHKPFLEIAPYLIAIFAQTYGMGADGGKIKHYYVTESVGIATGTTSYGKTIFWHTRAGDYRWNMVMVDGSRNALMPINLGVHSGQTNGNKYKYDATVELP